jgi:hypothetical protein
MNFSSNQGTENATNGTWKCYLKALEFCVKFLLLLLLLLLLLSSSSSFITITQGTSETRHVSTVYNVAAVL